MEWINSTDRFVGFFDIMGFKNYVFRNQHSTVKKRLDSLYRIINEIDSYYQGGNSRKSSVKISIFSDSIFIVTKAATQGDAKEIFRCSSWMIAKCMKEGIPIKGALSFGKITADFDKSIFFGKALIDAFLLQDELFMYGCILDDKIEKKIANMDCHQEHYLHKDKIPFKGGIVTHQAIDWMLPLSDELNNVESIIDKFYYSVSGNTRRYVDNTSEFAKKIKVKAEEKEKNEK